MFHSIILLTGKLRFQAKHRARLLLGRQEHELVSGEFCFYSLFICRCQFWNNFFAVAYYDNWPGDKRIRARSVFVKIFLMESFFGGIRTRQREGFLVN